jgi:hypothetical protein
MRVVSGLRGFVVGCLALILTGCAIAPPVQEMSDARQAIAAAEQASADRYAPDEIGEARRLIADAEQDIASEAYGPARFKALRAQDRAMRALRRSQAAAGEE